MKRIGCVCLLVAASLGSSPAFAGGGGGLCPAPTRSTTGSRVVMQQYCYKPADLSVRPGSEVTFLNDDEALHTVTSSGTSHGLEMKFEKGEWTTVRFTIPGVYTYRCDLHPFMVGVIRVGSASAAGASEGVTVVRSGPDPRANVPDDFSI